MAHCTGGGLIEPCPMIPGSSDRANVQQAFARQSTDHPEPLADDPGWAFVRSKLEFISELKPQPLGNGWGSVRTYGQKPKPPLENTRLEAELRIASSPMCLSEQMLTEFGSFPKYVIRIAPAYRSF